MRRLRTFATFTTLALVAGCQVGPDYVKPSTAVPETYKEAAPIAPVDAGVWNPARPADEAARSKWWEAFNDPTLNALEEQVTVSNQNLKVSQARFRQARAMVGVSRAAEFPLLTTVPGVTSINTSDNKPYPSTSHTTGDFTLPLDATYEVDLWGRIGRNVSSSGDEAQASAADLQTVTLSLHAELAIDYFNLRSADSQEKLLGDSVKAFADALQLTTNRANGGAAPDSDVAQAKTQLDTTRVQATDVMIQRAQYEHAIAALIGKTPAAFSLPPAPLTLHQPAIPAGLPSELLQRRPDVAAAERRVAEANEQIGIARAAYYPSLVLGSIVGFEGHNPSVWFNWPSLLWSVGATMTETLFDGGRRDSLSDAARANYDATVASYRQTTLGAFQQVEDDLSGLRILQQEAQQQDEAVASAQNSLQLFTNRYVGGRDTYLQVITAQTIALSNERNQTEILRRRMEASVQLIKALGGGWNLDSLPSLTDLEKSADAAPP
ncbi:MAG TPA: efflux transporter outer membrane subunit [Aliidongia sp.]|uniref:efflux transporter outer membrane subunit n=1 Tax=Aliidongia sp. TaxID=1914230 RepID=UPI002DDDAB16|nr:efflux transporter outer membrane subunit [Aliidongia sp.]HEV2678795.1 efflux transporter outer membrane subunit [Aliidongia sp.]